MDDLSPYLWEQIARYTLNPRALILAGVVCDHRRLRFQSRRWEEVNDRTRWVLRNNTTDGVHCTWNYNGQLVSEQPYDHGENHGVCKSWRYNGQLLEEEPYDHGERHGVCKRWHINGQLAYETTFDHGVPTGTGQP